MNSRIKKESVQPQINQQKPKVEEKLQKSNADTINFQKNLPSELKLAIVRHLMPLDAISFESVSHASRDLIANNKEVWAQHGLRPPIHLNEEQTLKQAWMSRAKTLSPELIAALRTQIKPLDVFSDEALEDFASHVKFMMGGLSLIRTGVETGNVFAMDSGFKRAFKHAEQAGLELPTVSKEMKELYLKSMKKSIKALEQLISKTSFIGMERAIMGIKVGIGKVDLPMPMPTVPDSFLENMDQEAKTAYLDIMKQVES